VPRKRPGYEIRSLATRLSRGRVLGTEYTAPKPLGPDVRLSKMNVVWHLFFWGCISCGFACFIAYHAGRVDLVQIFAAVTIILMGLVFLSGSVFSAARFGTAWVAGIGYITRKSHPIIYWAGLSVPILLGAVLLMTGIYILVQVA